MQKKGGILTYDDWRAYGQVGRSVKSTYLVSDVCAPASNVGLPL